MTARPEGELSSRNRVAAAASTRLVVHQPSAPEGGARAHRGSGGRSPGTRRSTKSKSSSAWPCHRAQGRPRAPRRRRASPPWKLDAERLGRLRSPTGRRPRPPRRADPPTSQAAAVARQYACDPAGRTTPRAARTATSSRARPRLGRRAGSRPRRPPGARSGRPPPDSTCSSVNSSLIASTSSQRPSISSG